MKPPTILTFEVDDFKNDPDKFVSDLNQFAIATGNVLDKGVSLEDNMSAQWNEFSLHIGEDSTPYPFGFDWLIQGKLPYFCTIGYIDSTDGVERVFSSVSPRWYYNNGMVVITGLRGDITTGYRYNIRFKTEAR